MTVQTWPIETPSGLARAHLYPTPTGRPRAALVLGHGVGGGVDAPDLVAIAAALPADGIEVVLIEAPWRVAGNRIGGPRSTLDRAWIACLHDVRTRGIGVRRLVVGGRSAGARVACRTVGEVEPAALLLLAFPLYPARRPSLSGPPPSRLPELVVAAQMAPTMVVQGTRDALGSPGEIAAGLAAEQVGARVVPVVDADHSFKVPVRSQSSTEEALDLVVRVARATALGIVDGSH
ncbi:MAG: alpha/beta family hydrolase [Candidatus Nanopelagicales bacterium]